MKKFLLCANVSLVLGTLLFLATRANAYCINLQGWSGAPQTINVDGYGDVQFAAITLPQLRDAGVAEHTITALPFSNHDTITVRFLGDPVWDVTAEILGRPGSEMVVYPWEYINEYTGKQFYSFHNRKEDSGETITMCFVPEPSTVLLGLLALPLVLRRKR